MIDYIRIGNDIIGACFDVRKEAGQRLREKYYKYALKWELERRGHKVSVEVSIPMRYKDIEIGDALVADMIVDDCVIIELKAVSKMGEMETRQLNTYLHLTGYKLGYLINFGAKDFCIGNLKKDTFPYIKGIFRVANGLEYQGHKGTKTTN